MPLASAPASAALSGGLPTRYPQLPLLLTCGKDKTATLRAALELTEQATRLGRPSEALLFGKLAVRRAQRMGELRASIRACVALSEAHAQLEELDPAVRLAQEAHEAAQQQGWREQALEAQLVGLESVASLRPFAIRDIDPRLGALSSPSAQCRLALLQTLACLNGDSVERAQGACERAVSLAEGCGDPRLTARAARHLAWVHERTCSTGAARMALDRSIEALGQADVQYELGVVLFHRAELEVYAMAEEAAATAWLQQALRAFERAGCVRASRRALLALRFLNRDPARPDDDVLEALASVAAVQRTLEMVALHLVAPPAAPAEVEQVHDASAWILSELARQAHDACARSSAALQKHTTALAPANARPAGHTEGRPGAGAPLAGLVGTSAAVRHVLETVRMIAPSPSTVLVHGESGVGKEVVARALHTLSGRQGRFMAINCAAIPEGLLEGELFGHEAGAYTGARPRGRPGIFEAASGGTLLLDEVSELPAPAQAKLLRVIQERRITRVGGHDEIPIDVRLVATSQRSLQTCVSAGAFREDLYFRLNVLEIAVPSLRERREDIPLLARHFLNAHATRLGRPHLTNLSEQTLAFLCAQPWPGNVRELENWVERAVNLAPAGHATLQSVGVPTTAMPVPQRFEMTQRCPRCEAPGLADLLALHGGNVARTAEALGVTRATVYSRMRSLGLSAEAFRSSGRKAQRP